MTTKKPVETAITFHQGNILTDISFHSSVPVSERSPADRERDAMLISYYQAKADKDFAKGWSLAQRRARAKYRR